METGSAGDYFFLDSRCSLNFCRMISVMFVPCFLARSASILRSSGVSQMAILVFLGSLWFGIIQILSAMYSPRVLSPRRLSSRSHSSWVIVTDLRMRVRPLPLPALRPAPLRLPPCVGFFFMLVEVVHFSPCGVSITNITGKRVDAEVNFPVAVFAPAELPLAGGHGKGGLIGGGFEVFNKKLVHGRN